MVKKPSTQSSKSNVTMEIRRVRASVVGAEVDTIALDLEATDIGVDSLMGIELLREIISAFGCKVDLPELLAASTVGQIVTLVASAVSEGAVDITDGDDDDNLSESSQDDGPPTSESSSKLYTSTSEVDSLPGIDTHLEEQAKKDVTAREVEAKRNVAEFTAGWAPAQPSYTRMTSQCIESEQDQESVPLCMLGP